MLPGIIHPTKPITQADILGSYSLIRKRQHESTSPARAKSSQLAVPKTLKPVHIPHSVVTDVKTHEMAKTQVFTEKAQLLFDEAKYDPLFGEDGIVRETNSGGKDALDMYRESADSALDTVEKVDVSAADVLRRILDYLFHTTRAQPLELDQWKSSTRDALAQVSTREKEIAGLRADIQGLHANCDSFKQSIEETDKRLISIEFEKSRLEREAQAAISESEASKRALEEARASEYEMRKQRDDAVYKSNAQVSSLIELRSKAERLFRELTDSAKRADNLEQSLNKANEDLQALTDKYARATTKSKTIISQKNEIISDLNAQLQDAQNEIFGLKEKLSYLNERPAAAQALDIATKMMAQQAQQALKSARQAAHDSVYEGSNSTPGGAISGISTGVQAGVAEDMHLTHMSARTGGEDRKEYLFDERIDALVPDKDITGEVPSRQVRISKKKSAMIKRLTTKLSNTFEKYTSYKKEYSSVLSQLDPGTITHLNDVLGAVMEVSDDVEPPQEIAGAKLSAVSPRVRSRKSDTRSKQSDEAVLDTLCMNQSEAEQASEKELALMTTLQTVLGEKVTLSHLRNNKHIMEKLTQEQRELLFQEIAGKEKLAEQFAVEQPAESIAVPSVSNVVRQECREERTLIVDPSVDKHLDAPDNQVLTELRAADKDTPVSKGEARKLGKRRKQQKQRNQKGTKGIPVSDSEEYESDSVESNVSTEGRLKKRKPDSRGYSPDKPNKQGAQEHTRRKYNAQPRKPQPSISTTSEAIVRRGSLSNDPYFAASPIASGDEIILCKPVMINRPTSPIDWATYVVRTNIRYNADAGDTELDATQRQSEPPISRFSKGNKKASKWKLDEEAMGVPRVHKYKHHRHHIRSPDARSPTALAPTMPKVHHGSHHKEKHSIRNENANNARTTSPNEDESCDSQSAYTYSYSTSSGSNESDDTIESLAVIGHSTPTRAVQNKYIRKPVSQATTPLKGQNALKANFLDSAITSFHSSGSPLGVKSLRSPQRSSSLNSQVAPTNMNTGTEEELLAIHRALRESQLKRALAARLITAEEADKLLTFRDTTSNQLAEFPQSTKSVINARDYVVVRYLKERVQVELKYDSTQTDARDSLPDKTERASLCTQTPELWKYSSSYIPHNGKLVPLSSIAGVEDFVDASEGHYLISVKDVADRIYKGETLDDIQIVAVQTQDGYDSEISLPPAEFDSAELPEPDSVLARTLQESEHSCIEEEHMRKDDTFEDKDRMQSDVASSATQGRTYAKALKIAKDSVAGRIIRPKRIQLAPGDRDTRDTLVGSDTTIDCFHANANIIGTALIPSVDPQVASNNLASSSELLQSLKEENSALQQSSAALRSDITKVLDTLSVLLRGPSGPSDAVDSSLDGGGRMLNPLQTTEIMQSGQQNDQENSSKNPLSPSKNSKGIPSRVTNRSNFWLPDQVSFTVLSEENKDLYRKLIANVQCLAKRLGVKAALPIVPTKDSITNQASNQEVDLVQLDAKHSSAAYDLQALKDSRPFFRNQQSQKDAGRDVYVSAVDRDSIVNPTYNRLSNPDVQGAASYNTSSATPDAQGRVVDGTNVRENRELIDESSTHQQSPLTYGDPSLGRPSSKALLQYDNQHTNTPEFVAYPPSGYMPTQVNINELDEPITFNDKDTTDAFVRSDSLHNGGARAVISEPYSAVPALDGFELRNSYAVVDPKAFLRNMQPDKAQHTSKAQLIQRLVKVRLHEAKKSRLGFKKGGVLTATMPESETTARKHRRSSHNRNTYLQRINALEAQLAFEQRRAVVQSMNRPVSLRTGGQSTLLRTQRISEQNEELAGSSFRSLSPTASSFLAGGWNPDAYADFASQPAQQPSEMHVIGSSGVHDPSALASKPLPAKSLLKARTLESRLYAGGYASSYAQPSTSPVDALRVSGILQGTSLFGADLDTHRAATAGDDLVDTVQYLDDLVVFDRDTPYVHALSKLVSEVRPLSEKVYKRQLKKNPFLTSFTEQHRAELRRPLLPPLIVTVTQGIKGLTPITDGLLGSSRGTSVVSAGAKEGDRLQMAFYARSEDGGKTAEFSNAFIMELKTHFANLKDAMFLETLVSGVFIYTLLPPNIQVKPRAWILRVIRMIYYDLNSDRSVAVRQSLLGPRFMAGFVISWARNRYGLNNLVLQLLWHIYATAVCYRDDSPECETFCRFLTDEYTHAQFLVFLSARKMLRIDTVSPETLSSADILRSQTSSLRSAFSCIDSLFSALNPQDITEIYNDVVANARLDNQVTDLVNNGGEFRVELVPSTSRIGEIEVALFLHIVLDIFTTQNTMFNISTLRLFEINAAGGHLEIPKCLNILHKVYPYLSEEKLSTLLSEAQTLPGMNFITFEEFVHLLGGMHVSRPSEWAEDPLLKQVRCMLSASESGLLLLLESLDLQNEGDKIAGRTLELARADVLAAISRSNSIKGYVALRSYLHTLSMELMKRNIAIKEK